MTCAKGSCWCCEDAMATEAKLRTDLASALARAEAAERENEAWRALAEWERYTNDRAVSWEDCGTGKLGDPGRVSAFDGSFGDYEGNGDSVQTAAIDLATKLGLLKPVERLDKAGG